jgi:hypothetical protein
MRISVHEKCIQNKYCKGDRSAESHLCGVRLVRHILDFNSFKLHNAHASSAVKHHLRFIN